MFFQKSELRLKKFRLSTRKDLKLSQSIVSRAVALWSVSSPGAQRKYYVIAPADHSILLNELFAEIKEHVRIVNIKCI